MAEVCARVPNAAARSLTHSRRGQPVGQPLRNMHPTQERVRLVLGGQTPRQQAAAAKARKRDIDPRAGPKVMAKKPRSFHLPGP